MNLKLKLTIIFLISTFCSNFVQLHAAESNSDSRIQAAMAACKNLTEDQRQMAQAAGYDLDSLCSESINGPGEVDTTNPTVVIPTFSAAQPSDEALEKIFAISYEALKNPSKKKDESKLDDDDDEKDMGDLDFLEYLEAQKNGEDLDDFENKDDEEDEEEIEEEPKLVQFGYDLFSGSPTTFAPATEIPVVSDYIIGPGDNINVQLFGKSSESFTLTVNRDGSVQFPELGPIILAGLTFDEMKNLLTNRVEKQLIGMNASITLGELRSIRIFILGDATRPGSYTVSSLSSMTNALFVSGGVRKIGSLRNIQLKRRGKVVSTFDLYDLLLKGDTSDDARLLPGDVIFIPPLGQTVAVAGEVKRPAIYELKNEADVTDLVALAGGYLPSAYPKASRLERINQEGDRTIIDVDLKTDTGAKTALFNGDFLQIYSVLEKMEDVVSLEGHVYRPGDFSFKKGMKVSDLINSIDNMLPAPDLDYALIVRETKPTREMKVLQVNLRSIFINSDTGSNVQLQAGDRLIIFAAIDDRLEILEPVIETLRSQERQAEPAKVVYVSGTINYPGEYPLTENMSVKELVFAGGGLKESTYTSAAEITRKDYSNPERASINHFSIPLMESLNSKNTDSDKLLAGDHLNLKLIPRFQEELLVTLEGEVKFPGVYEFVRGETLSDIITRAGGLTDLAHVEATFFSREDLKSKEEKQIIEFKERLKSDIAAAQLEDANSNKKTDVTTLNTLLDNLENSEATGRLVINLSAIMSHSVEDVQLRDGDEVIIPTYRQEITIIGEVQNPTSHVFNSIHDHTDYINKSGGATDKADESRIYVIKADGSVFLPEKSGWFHDDVTMSPGDTIVVPVETDSLDSLTLWTSVSQIIYQMSLGAAALSRL